MVYTRPPTSKSSSSFTNPLVTVPNAPITIGIIVTILLFWEFFPSALVDGFSLGGPWDLESQQLSLRLQDSSYIYVFLSLYQFFGDCTERTNYNW